MLLINSVNNSPWHHILNFSYFRYPSLHQKKSLEVCLQFKQTKSNTEIFKIGRLCPWGMKGRQTRDFHRMWHLQLLHNHVQYTLTCQIAPSPIVLAKWFGQRECFVCAGKKSLAQMMTARKLNHERYCREHCQLLLICPNTRNCWNKKQFTKSLNYFHL